MFAVLRDKSNASTKSILRVVDGGLLTIDNDLPSIFRISSEDRPQSFCSARAYQPRNPKDLTVPDSEADLMQDVR